MHSVDETCARLPALSLKASQRVEVWVAAQNRPLMLESRGRDPGVLLVFCTLAQPELHS